MAKLKVLTEEEAEARFGWLMHNAGPELDAAEFDAAVIHEVDGSPAVDAKVIEKLHEIKRVAAEVANYYLTREPQVVWEVGEG